MFDKVLTEQYILAILIKNPDKIDTTKNYFLSNIAQSIFKGLRILREKKMNITVGNIVLESVKFNSTVTPEKIKLIVANDYDLDSFDNYIEKLKEAYLQDKLKTDYGADLISALDDSGEPDIVKVNTILEDMRTTIHDISYEGTELVTLDKWLDTYKNFIIKRQNGETYYPIGCPLLDKYATIGMMPKYQSVIFSNSGVGKSSFGINLVNYQINRRIPVVYDTLEMDRISTMDRLISLRTGIPISIFMNREQDSDNRDLALHQIEIERKKLSKNNKFFLIEEASQSLDDLDYIIPDIKKFMQTDYFVLHIDLATMLKEFNTGNGSQANNYENAMNKAHNLVRKHNIHIVHYVQALRDSHGITIKSREDLQKFRPRLNSIKNSSAFEERCRMILGLFREKYYADRYLPNDEETKLIDDVMEVQFLKQTMGTLPILKYFFRGETSQVFPYVEPEKDEEHL